MSLRPERLTELLEEVAHERLSLRTGSESDAALGRENLAYLATTYIPELVDEVRRLSVLLVLPTLATARPTAPAATVEAGASFLCYLYEWLEDEAAKKLTEDVAHDWRANDMNGQFDDTFDAGETHGRGELATTLRTAIAAELLKHPTT